MHQQTIIKPLKTFTKPSNYAEIGGWRRRRGARVARGARRVARGAWRVARGAGAGGANPKAPKPESAETRKGPNPKALLLLPRKKNKKQFRCCGGLFSYCFEPVLYTRHKQTTRKKQISRQKQTTRQHPTTKQDPNAMKPVDLDALVPFIKVQGSESTG